MERPEEAETVQQAQEESEKKNLKGFRNGILVGMLGTAVILTVIYAVITAGKFLGARETQTDTEVNSSSVISTETLQKMRTIEAAINQYYFYQDQTSSQDIQEGIYKGMIEALDDPYSEYYTKEELEEVVNSTKGISYGIGAYISLNKETGMAVISGVIEDSPAQAAGLREGDVISEVDGESTQGMSLTEVVSRVKGREGTTVHLSIYREGENDFLELDIPREKLIETNTVTSGILEDADHIGYLRIHEFDNVTVDQYTEAMAVLREEGMKGLILDLRSNPGGDVNAVVEIARKILPQGLIVYTEDKYGNRKEYTCDGTHELEIPLVVLVNQYSASASELLAGAIQDYNKGTLIGTTTYGKGIVQQIHRLEDGTALKLTVSAYYTPTGRNIHGVGIEPDIEIEYDYESAKAEGIDNQVEKAIEILEGKIK